MITRRRRRILETTKTTTMSRRRNIVVYLAWKVVAIIIVCSSSSNSFGSAERASSGTYDDNRILQVVQQEKHGMVSGPVTVEFEYQLEVKKTNNSPGGSNNMGQSSPTTPTTTTATVLQDIDSNILLELQSRLPSNKLFNFSAPVVMTTSTMARTDGNTSSSTISSSSSSSRREERPNVRFQNISSQVLSPCFISSNIECIIVKSILEIQFDGSKPEYSIEQVAVHFIQDYFQKYNNRNGSNNNNKGSNKEQKVTITYLYPFFVTTNVEFDLVQSPVTLLTSVTSEDVHGENDDNGDKDSQKKEEKQQQQQNQQLHQQHSFGHVERWVLEKSFKDVFGVIVDVVEGDTKILDAAYVYRRQQVFVTKSKDEKEVGSNAEEISSASNKDEEAVPTTNSTTGTTVATTTTTTTTTMNIQILGECRSCSKSEFASFVNPIIAASLEVYRMKLIENGGIVQSTYFDNITSVEFGIPVLPRIIPTEHEELYNGQIPVVQKVTYPGFLSLGICLTVCILIGGAWFIRRELKYYAEDDVDDSEYSTSSESREDPSSVGVDGNDNKAKSKQQDTTTAATTTKVKDLKKASPDPVQTYGIEQKPSGGGGTLTTYENDSILDDTLASPRDYSRPRYHRGGGRDKNQSSLFASRLDPTGMIHDLREYQLEEDGSVQVNVNGPSKYV